jgi:hypothetical protein
VRGAAAWTATALLAATEAFGAETAAFLRLQPDARAAGMGEALTAASEGLSAFTVNPAGLALKPAREAGFSHSALYEATRLHQLSYAQPAGQDGAAGVSVRRLTHGGLEGRDAARARTGSFTAADTAVTAAYARKAAPGLVAGAALSYVDSQLADTHGRGVAGDLGVVWSREEAGLPVALGAAARNLGPGLKRDPGLRRGRPPDEGGPAGRGPALAPRGRRLGGLAGRRVRRHRAVPPARGLRAAQRSGFRRRRGTGRGLRAEPLAVRPGLRLLALRRAGQRPAGHAPLPVLR